MPIVGYQKSGVSRNSLNQLIVERLKIEGIVTLGDLDTWRASRHLSRYGALVFLVGEDAADKILNELAIRQCCHVANGQDYWKRQYHVAGDKGAALL